MSNIKFNFWMQGITKPAIRRLARRGGVKRISGNFRDVVPTYWISIGCCLRDAQQRKKLQNLNCWLGYFFTECLTKIIGCPQDLYTRRHEEFSKYSWKMWFEMPSPTQSMPAARQSLLWTSFMLWRGKGGRFTDSAARLFNLRDNQQMVFLNTTHLRNKSSVPWGFCTYRPAIMHMLSTRLPGWKSCYVLFCYHDYLTCQSISG